MVVVCEKCGTRFRLGDSRVPAEGARVRCSRCKHDFFVAPPGSRDADVVDEVLADVAGAAPERATGRAGPERREQAEPRAEERSGGDFEEDWQFNDDSHPHLRPTPEPAPATPSAERSDFGAFGSSGMDFSQEDPLPEIATQQSDPIGEPEREVFASDEPAVDPVESIRARDAQPDLSSSDDLGDLEDWDFLGTGGVETPSPLAPERDAPDPSLSSPDESDTTASSAELADSPTEGSPEAEEADRLPLATRFAGVASLAGWVVVALAFSVGISGTLPRARDGSVLPAAASPIAVSGLSLAAEEVEARRLENALVGDLLVVSGELENTGSATLIPGATLEVRLVSANRLPIAGATAVAGRPLGETPLRQWDPDRLRRELERSAAEMARRPLRPGARIPFQAVFESIPASAAGWALETATSASRPAPPSPLPPAAPPAWE